MTPRYCAAHGWHDGFCAAGKRTLTRKDFRDRITDIDGWLEDESAASLGYRRVTELQAEQASLVILAARIHG